MPRNTTLLVLNFGYGNDGAPILDLFVCSMVTR